MFATRPPKITDKHPSLERFNNTINPLTGYYVADDILVDLNLWGSS
jgi:hypothetical protein